MLYSLHELYIFQSCMVFLHFQIFLREKSFHALTKTLLKNIQYYGDFKLVPCQNITGQMLHLIMCALAHTKYAYRNNVKNDHVQIMTTYPRFWTKQMLKLGSIHIWNIRSFKSTFTPLFPKLSNDMWT